jgi:NAD(P)H-dependent FMN reductase
MKKLLLMAASVRDDSCNKKLINLIDKLCLQQKIEITKLDFANFLAPLYDGNFEQKSGLPDIVKKFIEQLKGADGLILSSPEYNFSTPGNLKNLIDWVSRANPMPWSKYPIMLCSASPASAGGHRGLLNTVTALQPACNAYVFPPMFSLSNAYEAFNSDGHLKNQDSEQMLLKNIVGFTDFVRALQKH